MSTGDNLDEDDMDTDVLPTPLTFRDSELVYAWTCVDWEARAMGNLQERLARFGSCPVHTISIMGHLPSIQLSCHRASTSLWSDSAHQ
jgi:hypothetical protein